MGDHASHGKHKILIRGTCKTHDAVREKWLRLFKQLSPIYKWTPGGLRKVPKTAGADDRTGSPGARLHVRKTAGVGSGRPAVSLC